MNKFAKQIDDAIDSYERCKSWHEHTIDWICSRIEWCWKWRKITEEEMSGFVDRICAVMEGDC